MSNRSYEEICRFPTEFRNSSEIRTCSMLEEVVKGTKLPILKGLWRKAAKLKRFSPSISPFLTEVNPRQFSPYITKVVPLLNELQRLHTLAAATERSLDVSVNPDSVPEEFFKESFTLKDFLRRYPEIEELSDYLDATDLSIFYKISLKWQSFLGTSHDLESIQKQTKRLTEKVTNMKFSGLKLEQNIARTYIKIVTLNVRVQNLKKLQNCLNQMKGVIVNHQEIPELLHKECYAQVSRRMNESSESLSSTLKGVVAMKRFVKQMEQIQINVGEHIDQELTKFVAAEVVESIFVHKEAVIQHVMAESEPILSVHIDKTRAYDLFLNKIDTLDSSLESLQISLLSSLKSYLKDLVKALNVVKTEDDSKWKTISHSHVIIVTSTLRYMLSFCSRKLKSLELIIAQLVSNEETPKDGEVEETPASLLKFKALEKAFFQVFINKFCSILQARRSIMISLEVVSISEIYREVKLLEKMYAEYFSTQTNISVTDLVISIENEYLDRFHNKKKKEITAILEGESWNKVDLPKEMTKFIMERRAEAVRLGNIKLKSPLFSSVSSLILFYKIIYDYIKICEAMNFTGQGVLILIDFMRYFNKITHQYILEGEAAKHTLKAVSSKHLGLSIQSLSFIIEELPYLQARLDEHCQGYHTHIDAVSEEFQEHLEECYNRLIDMIADRVSKQCESAVTSAKWSIMLSPSQLESDYYITQIGNDITVMMNVLQPVLSSSQIEIVFSGILQHVGKSLAELYGTVPISNYTTAQRVKNDIQGLILALRQSLGGPLQDNVEVLEKKLYEVISDKCQAYLT